jgi:sec-independent protein translocase protein TatC
LSLPPPEDAGASPTPDPKPAPELANPPEAAHPLGPAPSSALAPPAPPDSQPPGEEPSGEEPPGKPMSIWEHLDELRGRLVKAALGVLVTTLGAWNFRTQLLDWLVIPYQKQWQLRFPGKPLVLQTLAPGDAFFGYFELSLTAGIVLAVPVIFYQLWAFISPGLYKKEKRLIVPFVFFSSTLFLGGVAFAYYVATPFTFGYFLSLLGEVGKNVELTQIVTMQSFIDFTTRFHLAFGAVFELPLFVAFLVLANIVTPKQLLKFGRWATVLAFVVGAVVTPGPDVTSQLAVSSALIGLYFASIPIAFMLRPRDKKPPEGGGSDKKPRDGVGT